jgi:DNA-binding transcriptional LysR family regulator
MEPGANRSTISRRIGLLEAEFGARLFRRSGRGVAQRERLETAVAGEDR